ncbi:MAG: hypothetical protein HFJ31_01000 [Clostridia bacterium]|nr:hypothetical protein [Clostridia bacterium]
MKLKKIMATLLLAVMILAQFSFIQLGSVVTAANETTGRFHYDQLSGTAKKIYDGIVAMKEKLKTGTENYDLVANGHFTSDEVKSYEDGTVNLKKEFYAARYAFYADYPEIFYVSFNKLAIRTTKDANGTYHAYIGSGNNKDYRTEGFKDQAEVEAAIVEFESKVQEIVDEVNALEIAEGKSAETEKIKYVHNKITKMAGYRLEADCKPGNEDFLSTPYGILVKGQGVCEGYARAFKTILDKLGMTCILVQGIHQTDGSAVAHMWNYVQITEETVARSTVKNWYAVDVTMDDPYTRTVKKPGEDYSDREPGWDVVEGFENTRYLFVGAQTMAAEHVAVEKVEAAGNYEFKYPELKEEDLGIDTVTEVDGLVVKYKQEGNETEEYKSGDYYISYKGMGNKQAREQGYYLLAKYHEYRPGDEVWREGKWGYFDEEAYAGGFVDRGDYLYLTVPNGEYMEFAVTRVAPDPSLGIGSLTYQGDESGLIAQSGKLYNPSGTYRAKPYIKKQDPAPLASLLVGTTYSVTIVYDDDLLLKEGVTEVGYKFESSGLTGAECAKVADFKWDGKRTITFKFTPSEMFADDGASYAIYPTGLIGKNSGKEPMEILYGAVNQIACSFSMRAARNWELFARPNLMEDADLSQQEWITSDGEKVEDRLKNRIALVATKPTKDDQDVMEDKIENELKATDQTILKSSTYNLSLNACKKYVIPTGHRVRLSVGFPEGYGPEDAGVTFKAYHFMRDNKGNITGVEEIPCIVTQYGLIITCDSFSPFAIAAVNRTENDTTTTKQLVISTAANGKMEAVDEQDNRELKAAGNILDVEENESKTFRVIPDEGYDIETLTVCGKVMEITNKKSMEITVNYDEIKDGNVIIDATFVAETVAQAEEAKGETIVTPKATPAQITMNKTSVDTTINEALVIEPTVTQTPGTQTYQWYKDGSKLEGKTNKVLEIKEPVAEDTGSYTLKVTSSIETVSEETTSDAVDVTVRSFETTLTPTDSNLNVNELNSGDEFEVNINIGNFKNIDNGLYAIGGQLQYDTDALELVRVDGKAVIAQNGWEATTENDNTLKFITVGNNITTPGTMGKVKFRAKELNQDKEASIKMINMCASDADKDIASRDAELKVTVKEVVRADSITSNKYVIADEIISRVEPQTTIASFKGNVEHQGELVFKDKEGNIINDENTVLATGMTLQVGTTLNFTISVVQDVNGDGNVSITDLAQIMLHLVDTERLEGARFKAADINGDGKVTITDVAQLQLILVGRPIK